MPFAVGLGSAEKVFQLVGPTRFRGGMFVAPFFERFIEFTQQFALVLGELDWRFHRDVAIQIAGVTRAHTFDAFAT